MSHLSNGAVPSLNKSELDGYQRIHEHFNILPFDRTESYEESINRFFANNQAFEDAANLPITSPPSPPSPSIAPELESPVSAPQLPNGLLGYARSPPRQRQPSEVQSPGSSPYRQNWRGASEAHVSPPRASPYSTPSTYPGVPLYIGPDLIGSDSVPSRLGRDVSSSTPVMTKNRVTSSKQSNTFGNPSTPPRKIEGQLQMGFIWDRESLALLYRAKIVVKKGMTVIAASGAFPGHDKASLEAVWAQHKIEAKLYYQEVYGG